MQPHLDGGGVKNAGTLRTMKIRFEQNKAGYGGTIRNEGVAAIGENSVFVTNSAHDGGALVNCAQATVTRAVFRDNVA